MRRNMAGHRVIAPRKGGRVSTIGPFDTRVEANKAAKRQREWATEQNLIRIYEIRKVRHLIQFYVHGYTVK